MAYQPVLACSKNVDLVYGPSDDVPIVIMNMGDEKTVALKVDVKTLSGDTVYEQRFPDLTLKAGRTFKDLNLDIKEKLAPGDYAFEYEVTE